MPRLIYFPSTSDSRNPALNMRLNFLVVWKTLLLEFGEHQFAINRNFKATTAGWNQGNSFNILLKRIDNLIRHPDGLWFIASRCAIFNFYPGHVTSPFEKSEKRVSDLVKEALRHIMPPIILN